MRVGGGYSWRWIRSASFSFSLIGYPNGLSCDCIGRIISQFNCTTRWGPLQLHLNLTSLQSGGNTFSNTDLPERQRTLRLPESEDRKTAFIVFVNQHDEVGLLCRGCRSKIDVISCESNKLRSSRRTDVATHPAAGPGAAAFGGVFFGERLGLADLSPVLPAKSAFLSIISVALPLSCPPTSLSSIPSSCCFLLVVEKKPISMCFSSLMM